MSLHRKEIETVSSLAPVERYKYFIKKVADSKLLYTLVDEKGLYAISVLDNVKLLPFWSSNEYTELCTEKGWEEFNIKEISLDFFEDEIVDFISENNYLLNIFPVNDKTGFVVDIEEFARDLSTEMKNY